MAYAKAYAYGASKSKGPVRVRRVQHYPALDYSERWSQAVCLDGRFAVESVAGLVWNTLLVPTQAEIVARLSQLSAFPTCWSRAAYHLLKTER
jgi:hypothetical protein